MTRVISGAYGGRPLKTPKGKGTRPTLDRVKESLFTRLEHLDRVADARVLDLYAGSGGLGFEALSRGARHVTAVERERLATHAISHNARALGVGAHFELVSTSVETFIDAHAPHASYDLVLCDPPYAAAGDVVVSQIERIHAQGMLSPDACIVVEQSRRGEPLCFADAFEDVSCRIYGEVALWFAYTAPRTGPGGGK